MSISGMRTNMECNSQMALPLRQETSGIDSRTMVVAIYNRIEEQVVKVKTHKLVMNPLMHSVLVPSDMTRSTFQLPAVETLLRQFLPIEGGISDILGPQICWASPKCAVAGSSARALCTRLWPMRTNGDGNCLLHAISLTLWGVHDHSLVLRKLLMEVLSDRQTSLDLFHTWKDGQLREDAAGGASFQMNDAQVAAEWEMLVQAANTPSTCLSSFHAFVLANVLRRPIVIYGDRFVRSTSGEPYAPCDMRGVYLPTMLPASFCYDVPLAIGYTCVSVGKVGHFTALVGIETELSHLPLVDEHGDTLPIRYGVRPASPTLPDPVGDALDKYLKTTSYTTTEGRTCRLAIVPRVVMTTGAFMVGRTMARMAQASFERLSEAQKEQIKEKLEAATSSSDAPADRTAACVPVVKPQSAPVVDGKDRSVSPENRPHVNNSVGGKGVGNSGNVGHASRARPNMNGKKERKQDRGSTGTSIILSFDRPKTSPSGEGGVVASSRHKRFFGALGALSTAGSWEMRTSPMDSPSASSSLHTDGERHTSTLSKRKAEESPMRSPGRSSAVTLSSASNKIRRTMGQQTLSENWRWGCGGTSGYTPRGRQVGRSNHGASSERRAVW